MPDLILELHGGLSETRDNHDVTPITLCQRIAMRSWIGKLVFIEPAIAAEHVELHSDETCAGSPGIPCLSLYPTAFTQDSLGLFTCWAQQRNVPIGGAAVTFSERKHTRAGGDQRRPELTRQKRDLRLCVCPDVDHIVRCTQPSGQNVFKCTNQSRRDRAR